MEKKVSSTNSSFAVQFSKACYAFQFMREVFPGVMWNFEVRDGIDITIRATFDDTPKMKELCHLCAQQLAGLFPDIEVQSMFYNKAIPADPFWVMRGKFELNASTIN